MLPQITQSFSFIWCFSIGAGSSPWFFLLDAYNSHLCFLVCWYVSLLGILKSSTFSWLYLVTYFDMFYNPIKTGQEDWQGCSGDCYYEPPYSKHQWFSLGASHPAPKTTGPPIRHVSSLIHPLVPFIEVNDFEWLEATETSICIDLFSVVDKLCLNYALELAEIPSLIHTWSWKVKYIVSGFHFRRMLARHSSQLYYFLDYNTHTL